MLGLELLAACHWQIKGGKENTATGGIPHLCILTRRWMTDLGHTTASLLAWGPCQVFFPHHTLHEFPFSLHYIPLVHESCSHFEDF